MRNVSKWFIVGGIAALIVSGIFLVLYWGVQPTRLPPVSTPPAAPAPAPAPFAMSTNTIPVDLAQHYNAPLHQQWNRTSYPGDDLAELPAGVQEFNGVRFDIQGIIQLQGGEWEKRGLRYPNAVEGITVGRTCKYLYALHADGGANAPSGATVAQFVLHYSDGSTGIIAIQHDVHVKDWWSYGRPPPSDPNTVVAWTGSNKATASKNTSIRLYLTRFENPYPGKKVETLDYVSTMAAPGPFMVGVTVE